MKIHVRKPPSYKVVLKGQLWDMDDNKEVVNPIWFDVTEGLFQAYQSNPMGKIRRTPQGDRLTYTAKGNIKWIPATSMTQHKRIFQIGRKCEKCTRDAMWQVADEVALPPLQKGNRAYGRGRLTDIRYYCDHCYDPPRVLDEKGEVMQVIEDGCGARPQWHS